MTLPELQEFSDFIVTSNPNQIPSNKEWSILEGILFKDSKGLQSQTYSDMEPFTTQTQNQILSLWKPEFETPLINKIAPPQITPKTPTVFSDRDDNFNDYDYFDDHEIINVSSQTMMIPQKQLFQSNQNFNTIDFKTASGKSVAPPSPANCQKAIDLLNPDPFLDISENTTSFVGFLTAGGKKVKSPSKLSLAKAEELLKPLPEESVDGNVMPLPSFSTASGKRVKTPSKESVEIAKKKFHDFDHPINSPPNDHKPAVPTKAIDDISLSSNRKSNVAPPTKTPTPQTEMTKTNNDVQDLSPKRNKTLARNFFYNVLPTFCKDRLPLVSLRGKLSTVRSKFSSEIGDIQEISDSMQNKFPQVSTVWIENHIIFILWKYFSYISIGFEMPISGTQYLTYNLQYRYEHEYHHVNRSILKRISERDESPSIYMILFIYSIEKIDQDKFVVSLSDGWYRLKVIHDLAFDRLIRDERIKAGMKIKLALSQLISEDACDILEADDSNVRLKIHGNSCRPARWWSKLGKQKKAIFTISLSSIEADGGTIPCINIAVLRRFPLIYCVEMESGKRQNLTQEKFDNLVRGEGEIEGTDKISVVKICVKFKAVDISGCPKRRKTIISLWDSNHEVYNRIKEGASLKIIGLKPSIQKSDIIYLSSQRISKIIFSSEAVTDFDSFLEAPLTQYGFFSLEMHKDYDIDGVIISISSDYLWVGIGEVDLEVAAIKISKDSLQKYKLAHRICLHDVSFLYTDPRHYFPIFLFADYSRAEIKGPSTVKKSSIDVAQNFVKKLSN